MNTIRLQLRFLLPLVITVVGAAYLAVPLMDRLNFRWSSRELNLRGSLVTNALSDSIAEALRDNNLKRLQPLFSRAMQDERLVAIGLCAKNGRLLYATAGFPRQLTCEKVREISAQPKPELRLESGNLHIGVHPVSTDAGVIADLAVLHDLGFIEKRNQDARQYLIVLIGILGILVALITVAVAHLSWRGWVKGARALLRGEGLIRPMSAPAPELAPLAADLRERLHDLEDEYRRSLELESGWNPDRLRSLLRTRLRGDQVIVVSNREPYIHERHDGEIVVKRPASGLVTAVEPVMRACSGTWIAHGSGKADAETVDSFDRVRVPPGRNEYTLRRIWLTDEEEQGYYYGFANEGLWPLCHVAHVRPVFRESDWQRYRQVNERFARAVLAEARSDDPVVLVQDYHFALLPAIVRELLPRATILTFWHIPWPNPESFGICPWQREILQGMLGSTILGFHTPFHCKNFIETVDRYLQARIEHEHSSITFEDKSTLVESYPISIEWPDEATTAGWPSPEECRRRVCTRHGLDPSTMLAVGVDRFDYTKGILERLNAVERLLEKHKEWLGKFVFLQVAAPSRTSLEEYQAFQQRIQNVTERINRRFGATGYNPVHLLAEHHEHDALTEIFRAADVCLVTSLHDGMNLVSKEFVADPHNFNVDIPAKRVNVSMLFSPEWYEKDFLADKRFHGKKAVEYLIPYVDKPTAEFLAAGDYTVSYIDWNWSLNGTTASK